MSTTPPRPDAAADSPADARADSRADAPADRTADTRTDAAVIELDAADLPAFCPHRRMTVWSAHPRVFLDLSHTGQARCPYCSTEYRLRPGVSVKGH
jgi:uncharacterized Zn-finger protein